MSGSVKCRHIRGSNRGKLSTDNSRQFALLSKPAPGYGRVLLRLAGAAMG
jgi:hypothetical protein